MATPTATVSAEHVEAFTRLVISGGHVVEDWSEGHEADATVVLTGECSLCESELYLRGNGRASVEAARPCPDAYGGGEDW